MGNQNTTPKPPVHEDIIRIVNANVAQTAHLEKTANATSILAYAGITIIVLGLLYILYKLVIRYERLKTENRIKKVVSLSNILTENWSVNWPTSCARPIVQDQRPTSTVNMETIKITVNRLNTTSVPIIVRTNLKCVKGLIQCLVKCELLTILRNYEQSVLVEKTGKYNKITLVKPKNSKVKNLLNPQRVINLLTTSDGIRTQQECARFKIGGKIFAEHQ